jgi:hypothetical protein
MDIITATKIIQDQAIANGTSFDDEFWSMSNNLKYLSKDVYDAWTVFHNVVNESFAREIDQSRIAQLARDVKKLNADQRAYFDSI